MKKEAVWAESKERNAMSKKTAGSTTKGPSEWENKS
jgi:hypothetical protein